ncbi:Panacea domain-containing protein [Chitinophaga sp. GCM10012297]|uniref:DUF4065 domain-containing protein n=1 Tax=Chitinophaga chungangae TaxID=2821488 RepID=A0ABS3YGX2_9BACT|nr:type II toxin-antitoxin system antitoxin SocA domain-containing protein [Chitinophaga chungangae]MBO9153700.1 DUF4065 domain-containing protein [Chitinophaga chungangae]
MSYNPTTIANYFIGKYAKKDSFTPMKVIKLTYIAYGWYLALTDKKERLIDESPVSWDFGPFFPSLFLSLKKYGKMNITAKIPNSVGNQEISPEDKKFLDRIWQIYGRFDGIYLSAMVNKENAARRKADCKDRSPKISDDVIYEQYKKKMLAIPAS